MMTEIIRELATIEKTNESTRNQVVSSAKGVGAQKAQKTTLDATKESREFDMVMEVTYNGDNRRDLQRHKNKPQQKCKYCSAMYEL